MNRSGLIELLSKEIGLTKKNTEEIIDVVFDAMSQALINGERIEIRGLGSFGIKNYDGYLGRNPRTGEKIEVLPKRLPFFRVGKDLKEKVDH
jgi:integration host factor subunit beta